MNIKLSDAEKVFIIHGCQEGFRNDGRSCEDYRPISVERGVLCTTDGSARVRVGGSDILVGAKCELLEVEDSSKIVHRINFNVDCSANATPLFRGMGGDLYAEEVADFLSAAYNNDDCIPDLVKLSVSSNHYWNIYVDVVILQCGGNIVDAASIGVKSALHDMEICVLRTRKADENKMVVEVPDGFNTFNLDVSRAPLIVSVSKIGTSNIVDASLQEEACSLASLWVSVIPPTGTSPSLVTATRQAGGASLDGASIPPMVQLAVHSALQLHSQLDERLQEEPSDEALQSFLLS